jgi:hypothetical protein
MGASTTPEAYHRLISTCETHSLLNNPPFCAASHSLPIRTPGPGRGHKAKKTGTPRRGTSFSQHKKNIPTKTKATQDFKVSRNAFIYKLHLLGWTQEEIGHKVGISHQAVSKIATEWNQFYLVAKSDYFEKQ